MCKLSVYAAIQPFGGLFMLVMRLAGLVFLSSLLLACSNDDDDTKDQGSIGFLHTVVDAAQIRLEGNDRNFGTFFYESLGAPIALREGGYSADIVSQDLQNSALNETIATTSFNVSPNRIRLSVLYGQIADDSVASKTFVLARDDDAASNDNETDERYLNVSNVFTGADSVTFTFKDPDDVTLYTESLAFGETSTEIMFDTQRYVITVTNDDDDALIYQSTQQVVEDQIEQTLILANYAGISNTPDASMKAYYYGTVFRRVWANQLDTAEGYLKVSSALLQKDSNDDVTTIASLDFEVFQDEEGVLEEDLVAISSGSVNFGTSSDYIPLAPGEYWLKVNSGVKQYFVTMEEDVAKNVSFAGYFNASTEAPTPLTQNVDKRLLANSVTIHFQHLATSPPNDDSPLSFDAHISPTPSLDSSTLILAGVGPRAEAKFAVNLDDSLTYKLYLTEAGDTQSSVASYQIPVANGDGSIYLIAHNASINANDDDDANNAEDSRVLGITISETTKEITP